LSGDSSDGPGLPSSFAAVLARIDAGSPVTVIRDVDRNGFWEERYHFVGGRLQRWELDDDQDGRVTRVAVFEDGKIRYYHWDPTSAETVQVQYSGFPRVDRVRWIDEAGTLEWLPPRPVPYEVGRLALFSLEPRAILGSVAAGDGDGDVVDRFSRQRLSDDRRDVGHAQHQAELERMRGWGMIR
jgi:hypothetical protein